MLNLRQTIYVQVNKNEFSVLHADSGKTGKSSAAFSNVRLAIAHFSIAQQALKKAVAEVYSKLFFHIAPVIVMHQIYNSEGGLCEIEDRILREVAFGAGGGKIFVSQGHVLSASELLARSYEVK